MSIWGPAQTTKPYGKGVKFITTSTHGGFVVSPSVNTKIPAEFKNMTFGQEGWNGFYEEDQDWMYVILAIPERFEYESLEMAFNSFMTHIKWVREKGRRT